MLTKEQHVAYWMETADDNWHSIQNMVSVGEYVPALFWAHLAIEKLSKALWVKDNEGNTPPRIHNIIKLLNATSLLLTDEQVNLAGRLNTFQLEGRYPTYLQELRRIATKPYTHELLTAIAEFRQCLLNKLPSTK